MSHETLFKARIWSPTAKFDASAADLESIDEMNIPKPYSHPPRTVKPRLIPGSSNTSIYIFFDRTCTK